MFVVCVRDLSRARCQYSSLSFLFSPLYHHDNLLTPAQPHTANISLPSPSDMFIFLTPSPYTPSLSLSLSSISTLYSAFISCLQCLLLLPISGFLQFPLCLHATFSSSFLTVVFAESLSFICAAPSLSLLYPLLPADCLSLLISVQNFPFSLPELLYPTPPSRSSSPPSLKKEAYGTLPYVCPALHLHYNHQAKIIQNAITGSILSTFAINFYQA